MIETYIENRNNKAMFKVDMFPDEAYIDVNQCRDICKIKLMPREKLGSLPDKRKNVEVRKSNGVVFYITRKELKENFTLLNGKKIPLLKLKCNQEYIVIGYMEAAAKAFLVPDNCNASFNGKIVNGGNYIIFNVNEDSSINHRFPSVINKKVFRKMYKVPPQPVILRHRSKPVSTEFNLMEKRYAKELRGKDKYANKIEEEDIEYNVADDNFNDEELNNVNIPIQNIENNIENSKNTGSNYEVTVLNRVYSMQDTSKLMGYTIKSLKLNKTKVISESTLLKLAKKKLVDNIEYVEREGIDDYIRGNGISIENLPKIVSR